MAIHFRRQRHASAHLFCAVVRIWCDHQLKFWVDYVSRSGVWDERVSMIVRLSVDVVHTRPASKPPATATGGLLGNLGQGAPSSAPVAPTATAASAAPAASGGFSFGGFGSKPTEAAGGAKDQPAAPAAPAAGGGGGLFGFGAKKDTPAPTTS